MASKLINDLTKVPNIIADLGLGIANAQKQMNSGYLDALRILVAQVASITKGLPEGPETAKFVSELLMNLAPPRYQFTQTELNVKLDLSQSIDVSVQAGIGFGLGAFVVMPLSPRDIRRTTAPPPNAVPSFMPSFPRATIRRCSTL